MILDADLAHIYGVPTKRLNEQVRRNADRFPPDFMIQLTPSETKEIQGLRSQIATASKRNVRFLTYAFTEHGAIMAANVLNSPEAIRMSVFVVRAFVKMREALIGGQKVMVDADLAMLYGIPTRSLIQAVRRNEERFPSDFMFRLNQEKFDSLRSQIVISKGRGGRRYLPYAFTEQGVAMLSSVLHSQRAILVNIAIMRVFVQLREMMATHKELAVKLRELEGRIQEHDEQIVAIFEAIRQLMTPADSPRKRIGFEVKEKKAAYGK